MQLGTADKNYLTEASDESLAVGASNDFHAFEELYRRYLTPIYRYVRSQTPDDATAEDLTAHVFFRALSSAATFRADGCYKAWIFRIAHNTIVSWRDRSGRAQPVEAVPEAADPAPSPASQAIAREARGHIWKKVAELPDAQREVVTLKYVEDLSNEEIAKVTNRSRGAVRILMHRARSKLRHSLEGKDLL
jgi:RNA polymerase sigma-70 factor (ECF subfamily)